MSVGRLIKKFNHHCIQLCTNRILCLAIIITTVRRPGGEQADPLVVRDATRCPRFAVDYDGRTVTVNVSNDATGAFRALLARSWIACQLDGESVAGKTSGAGSQIVCGVTAARVPAAPILYFSVTANNMLLAFDTARDHYLTPVDQHAYGQECADCFWDDDAYRHYCRWCPRGDKSTGLLVEHCDIRRLDDLSRAVTAADGVLVVQCPAAIRIESFEPAYGPRSGGTTVRIAVANSEMARQSEKRTIRKVMVAGRVCVILSAVPELDGSIRCTIPRTNSSRTDSGPVEVTYASVATDATGPLQPPAIVLRSSRKFYFVEPDGTGMRPTCGPVTGGTVVTVVGNYLDAGNGVRVYVVGDPGNATSCAVTSYGPNNVTCVTGAAAAPYEGRVRLQFDGHWTAYVPDAVFEYTGRPTVDGGQTFRAIVSGGTRIPVRGRYLSCTKNPLVYVTHDGFKHTAGCEVRNSTYMECRTPKIRVGLSPMPWSQPAAIALEFGFQAEYGENAMHRLQHAPVMSRYLLYPDPVYTDFETDGRRTVIINGRHLDRGYYVRADLQVWFRDSAVGCNVTLVRPDRVVCKTPAVRAPLLPAVGALDQIDVTFGNVVYNVKRKTCGGRREAHNKWFASTLFSTVAVLSLFATTGIVVVHCAKIRPIGRPQIEMQVQLCEIAPDVANGSSCTNGGTGNNDDDDNDNTTAADNGALEIEDDD